MSYIKTTLFGVTHVLKALSHAYSVTDTPEGFSHCLDFLHDFVLAKVATSTIRVSNPLGIVVWINEPF